MAQVPPWTSATCALILSLSWSVGEAHSLLSRNSRRALTHSALPLAVHLYSSLCRFLLVHVLTESSAPPARCSPSQVRCHPVLPASSRSQAPPRSESWLSAIHLFKHARRPPTSIRLRPPPNRQGHRPDLKPGALYLLSDQSTLTPRCSTAPPWKPPSGEPPPCSSPQ
jgi:hypothetical protein